MKRLFEKCHAAWENPPDPNRDHSVVSFLQIKNDVQQAELLLLEETPWASSALRIQNRQMFQNGLSRSFASPS